MNGRTGDSRWCFPCGKTVIVRPSPDGEALVTLLCQALSVREGETLTPELIVERARNAAASLLGAYRMEPIE